MIGSLARLAGTALILAATAVLPSAPGAPGGDDDPATTEDVLDAVSHDVATHFVILIDTSGSMARNGLYGNVRSAVVGFGSALGPADTVSVIPFDEGPGTPVVARIPVPR